MFNDGLFGDPTSPQTKKRVQDMIRMGYSDFEIDRDQRDQEQAQLENIKMGRGEELQKPQPWEDHQIHWEAHVDLFKSPEAADWPDAQRVAYAWHAIVHLSYLNPEDAMKMAGEFGLRAKLEQLLALQQPAPPPPPPQMPMMDPSMMGQESLLAQLPPMPEPMNPMAMMGGGGPV